MIKNKIIIATFFIFFAGSRMLAENPNFELWNKTKSDIEVKISFQNVNGTVRHETIQQIPPNRKFYLYNVKFTSGLNITFNRTRSYIIMPCFMQNCYKTVYLSYDQTGLRPQKGKLRGWSGRTDSNFDNSNNITSNFIQKSSLAQ